ncbi:dimethylarginine dimethylaminohydrolase family protein [Dolosicoccus paucivorans]|uniref:N(G),N(G)-dimethylarginine dimethylaminohydrolase n=1 Tax=Dolosicoccus paucivorans TaxID=84521 RepID=A0A2N6SLM5_9LACT|nr:arginine deiminase family protein [Dolosicoccus paucivorans]PMB83831.1 N(G),N(G)-dimethylarginine dimethylaminohydrolase [Dolosicoccus paucivorans]PMC57972.1 N(G),N(G)-dimethylarginine dimethylaminohydrolase [Dolosicoccus paucivorans]
MTHFKNAIVRLPGQGISEGITSDTTLGKPDYKKALVQHSHYVSALTRCGVKVNILPPNDDFPDSCFMEDTALCTDKCVIISRPGTDTRMKETQLEDFRNMIQSFYTNVHEIKAPGTVEPGDIMMVGDTFYVGRSERTNKEGIRQVREILESYGKEVVEIPLTEVLHLKTGVNYIEDNNLLVSGEFIDNPHFENFNKIVVDSDEAYASNCLWINGKVIVPEDFPKVRKAIEHLGYEVIVIDTSEFRKIDGGLSCLSLRF